MQTLTQFEIEIKTPKSINYNGVDVNYYQYQLRIHHFNLKLMIKGMKFTNITLSQIKKYYGLKGNGDNLLKQFESIKNNFESSLQK